MLAAHSTLIDFNNKLKMRSDRADFFNTAMGSSDLTQVTDFVGIFFLFQMES